jgi:hypothetical protein
MSQLSQSAVAVSVRDAQPSDHPSIGAVLQATYQEYATVLPPGVFDLYLRDISASKPAPASGSTSSPNATAGSWER